jgi:hypothetical protein
MSAARALEQHGLFCFSGIERSGPLQKDFFALGRLYFCRFDVIRLWAFWLAQRIVRISANVTADFGNVTDSARSGVARFRL